MSQYFNVRSGGPHIGRHSPSASDAEERPALLNEIKKSSLGIYIDLLITNLKKTCKID